MSIKSRNRANKSRNKQTPSNPLFLQKQAIRSAMFEYFGAAALFFVFAVAAMIMEFFNGAKLPWMPGVFLAELIILSVCIFYFVSFLRRFTIFQQLRKIKFSTEQSVSVYCRKISFLLQPVSRFSSKILCITLVGKSGNKFYYVFPENSATSDFSKKHIKEQCLGNRLELSCYYNTNIVKTMLL